MAFSVKIACTYDSGERFQLSKLVMASLAWSAVPIASWHRLCQWTDKFRRKDDMADQIVIFRMLMSKQKEMSLTHSWNFQLYRWWEIELPWLYYSSLTMWWRRDSLALNSFQKSNVSWSNHVWWSYSNSQFKQHKHILQFPKCNEHLSKEFVWL